MVLHCLLLLLHQVAEKRDEGLRHKQSQHRLLRNPHADLLKDPRKNYRENANTAEFLGERNRESLEEKREKFREILPITHTRAGAAVTLTSAFPSAQR